MLLEAGFCPGIENYSRPLSGRAPGSTPETLFNYFPEEYLFFVDESHVTVPQVRGMYAGDKSRKTTLVDHGFRLPSAMDNRPLKFDEWEKKLHQTIYVSATPGEWELERTGGEVVEQVIRPTGLLDPVIEIVPARNQVTHLAGEIATTVKAGHRVLVTTLTKKLESATATGRRRMWPVHRCCTAWSANRHWPRHACTAWTWWRTAPRPYACWSPLPAWYWARPGSASGHCASRPATITVWPRRPACRSPLPRAAARTSPSSSAA
jgi:hypothetical protein